MLTGSAMLIDSIYLRDVGPFDEVRIDLPEGKDPNLADVYLLTGPNGCGKSTVLYAIAGVLAGGNDTTGADLISPRLRGENSIAAISGAGDRGAVTTFRHDRTHTIPDPFGGPPLQWRFGLAQGVYWRDPGPPSAPQERFDSMAFAYAGSRSMQDAHVTAIQEIADHPMLNCLAFEQATDTSKLVHWIASQYLKELKAERGGNAARASQLSRSVRDIESIITEITGDVFAFDLTGDDNDVRVRRNGVVIDMGVLPEGLKSIVSWVSDLLMRLDRMPWVDDTPPMQRSFLLLLDEIDVHLHPAWQRKVIPIVQKLFPKAQIIASTHSPFVVASANDAHIITFAMKDGVSKLESIKPSQIGVSYSAVLRDIFGITSEFDVETEQMLASFHEAKTHLLEGTTDDRATVDQLAQTLAARGEELSTMMGFEMRQIDRYLKKQIAG